MLTYSGLYFEGFWKNGYFMQNFTGVYAILLKLAENYKELAKILNYLSEINYEFNTEIISQILKIANLPPLCYFSACFTDKIETSKIFYDSCPKSYKNEINLSIFNIFY